MTQETWLVVAVGAGFLLMGIAASPLGWAALLHRRGQADRDADRRFGELNDQVTALRARVERCESAARLLREGGPASGWLPPAAPVPTGPVAGRRPSRRPGPSPDGPAEPRLIAVPKLAAVPDRQAMQDGLSQRYAAIWELAESGASPDAIARATGQPIGQIELILGLRRQIDATRTTIPHASHE